jgi:hypothetical protein
VETYLHLRNLAVIGLLIETVCVLCEVGLLAEPETVLRSEHKRSSLLISKFWCLLNIDCRIL